MAVHTEATERLGEQLRWSRAAAGDAEGLRLVPPAGVEAPPRAASAGVDPPAARMAAAPRAAGGRVSIGCGRSARRPTGGLAAGARSDPAAPAPQAGGAVTCASAAASASSPAASAAVCGGPRARRRAASAA